MRLPRYSVVAVAVAAALILPAASGAVVPNDYDSSYGSAGISTPGISLDSSQSVSAALQSDDKPVVLFARDGSDNATVARFNGDGSVDSSFGSQGSAAVGTPSNTVYTSRVLVAPDGTIYAVATLWYGGKFAPAVWAFAPSGAPKTSFNGDGVRVLSEADNTFAIDAMIRPGGLALVARTGTSPNIEFKLYDVYENGTLGNTSITGQSGVDIWPDGIASDGGDRVYVSASLGNSSDDPSKVYGFHNNMQPDSSFGVSGVQTVGVNGAGAPIYSIAFINGTLMVGGTQLSGAMVTLYKPDGTLVTSAGPNGTNRFVPLGSTSAYVDAFAAGDSGKFYTTGDTYSIGSGPAYLARFNADGTLDASAGVGGIYAIGGPFMSPYALLRQADGKFLVIGANSSPWALTLRRIWGDGQPTAAGARFGKSLKSKLRAKKLRKISGTATGTELLKVEIAIQRIDAKLLKKKKRCAYVKSTKLSVKKVKAVKGKCVPSVWIKAVGTAAWSLKLKKSLKPGKYVFSARATGLAGAGRTFKKTVKITK